MRLIATVLTICLTFGFSSASIAAESLDERTFAYAEGPSLLEYCRNPAKYPLHRGDEDAKYLMKYLGAEPILESENCEIANAKLSTLKVFKSSEHRGFDNFSFLMNASNLEVFAPHNGFLCDSYRCEANILLLRNFKNLKQLHLSLVLATGTRNVNDSDLEAIGQLRNLSALSAVFGEVKSLEPLTRLKKLERLTFYEIFPTRVLSKLPRLPSVKTLKYYSYRGADEAEPIRFAALAKLSSVEELELGFYGTQVSLISLPEIPSLKRLNLRTRFNSLEGIERLTNLTRLRVYSKNEAFHPCSEKPRDCENVDLSALEKTSRLESLSIVGPQDAQMLVNLLPTLPGLKALQIGFGDIRYPIVDLQTIAERAPRLESLILADHKIQDLAPISRLKNLRYLDLSNNSIRDIQPLAALANLEFLNLSTSPRGTSGNRIRDIRPLAGLTRLRALEMYNNPVEDYSPLSPLSRLQYLNLDVNSGRDAQFLSGLKDLRFLSLGTYDRRPIANIEKIGKLTELRFLEIQGAIPHGQNLEFLAALSQLETIDLSGNGLSDVSVLERLPSLKSASVYCNPIADISGLTRLVQKGVTIKELKEGRIACPLFIGSWMADFTRFIDVPVELRPEDSFRTRSE